MLPYLENDVVERPRLLATPHLQKELLVTTQAV